MRFAKRKVRRKNTCLKIGNFVIGESLGSGSFGKVKGKEINIQNYFLTKISGSSFYYWSQSCYQDSK